MKKFVCTLLTVFSLSLFSSDLFASDNIKKSASAHPSWEEFKSIIDAYHHSNVDFYYTSPSDQKAFLEAAEEIKHHLQEKNNPGDEVKIKKIERAVAIFTYIWSSQSGIDSESVEPLESIEIPAFE